MLDMLDMLDMFDMGEDLPRAGSLVVQTAEDTTVRVTSTSNLLYGEVRFPIHDYDPVTAPPLSSLDPRP